MILFGAESERERSCNMTRDECGTARLLALTLASKHPGWGCRRISDAMHKHHGVSACKSVVAEWVRDAGLAPANRRLRAGDWLRREAVTGTCGHPVAPPPVDEPTRRVLCFQCGWVEVRRANRRVLVADADARKPPAKSSIATIPDTAPTAGEHELYFVDRRVSTVARDLLDRMRYGSEPVAQVRAELRRAGLSDEEVDLVLAPTRPRSRAHR